MERKFFHEKTHHHVRNKSQGITSAAGCSYNSCCVKLHFLFLVKQVPVNICEAEMTSRIVFFKCIAQRTAQQNRWWILSLYLYKEKLTTTDKIKASFVSWRNYVCTMWVYGPTLRVTTFLPFFSLKNSVASYRHQQSSFFRIRMQCQRRQYCGPYNRFGD